MVAVQKELDITRAELNQVNAGRGHLLQNLTALTASKETLQKGGLLILHYYSLIVIIFLSSLVCYMYFI